MGSRTPVNRLEIDRRRDRKRKNVWMQNAGGLLCVVGKQVCLFTASVFLVKEESRSAADNQDEGGHDVGLRRETGEG